MNTKFSFLKRLTKKGIYTGSIQYLNIMSVFCKHCKQFIEQTKKGDIIKQFINTYNVR